MHIDMTGRKNEMHNAILPMKLKGMSVKLITYWRDPLLVVVLPPFSICDLNPIEVVWVKTKGLVHGNDAEAVRLQTLLPLTKGEVALLTKEAWEGFCRHTETVENQYRERDGIFPEVIGRIVINLTLDSDSDSDCGQLAE
jgi:hypothetical protein